MKKSLILLVAVSYIAVFSAAQAGSLERLFAPKPKLWDAWTEHNPASTDTIDHGAWSKLLQQYVTEQSDGINRVDYENVSGADRQQLKDYINTLSELPISSFSRDEQLSFWINLYNALTVDVILDHYPVSSIRKVNLSPGLFKDGPWGKKLLRIEGRDVSLNDIEHRILRPIWKDPRLHYALNCASLGCPNLQRKAYTPENADTLMNQAATDFINHPRGISMRDGKLVASSIYNWFRRDFGKTDRDILEHIQQYAYPDLRQTLNDFSSIDRYEYDWSLNDMAGAGK
jgi:hypothetical protein